jgi:3-deoxy-D-manno-octulosonic-acid transferase
VNAPGSTEQSDRRQRLPAPARRSLAIYNLLFPVAFLLLLPGYLLRMLRRGGYRGKFTQRLGIFTAADREDLRGGGATWIHSISVGETLLALKIAREMRRAEPERKIVLSVTTSTGYAVAAPAAGDWLAVIYNPLDLRSVVRRTLRVLKPKRLIFIEAIWPNLLAEAKQLGISIYFIPRLSPRSERRFTDVKWLIAPIFALLDRLAVAEPVDIERWKALGVPVEKISVTGNSKFDPGSTDGSRVEEFRALLAGLEVEANAPILLGGSTFPGEERILAEAMLQLRPSFPGLLLILVPRHAERADEIVGELRPFGLRLVRRSALAAPGATSERRAEPPDILLVDSTGELRDWYQLATVVFIGKSLTATGGQNPVEPVLAGKPVIFGPRMENFEPIVSRWLAADAAVRVVSPEELQTATATLLADPERCSMLAARARAIALAHEGATRRTVEVLLGVD